MRYFEKQSSLWGSILGRVGKMAPKFTEKSIESGVLGKATKFFGNASDTLSVKSVQGLSDDLGAKIVNHLENTTKPTKVLSRQDASTLIGRISQTNRIRDYAKKDGYLKGLSNYISNEILPGGKGVGFKQTWSSLKDSPRFFVRDGKVYQRSKFGRLLHSGIEYGGTALYAKDAFTELEPGETRTGKILGAAAGLQGFMGARKGIAGLVRGSLYGSIGSTIGNNIGKKKAIDPTQV